MRVALGGLYGHNDDLSLAADPEPVTTTKKLAAFRHDLETLSEGSEQLPAPPLTYSRSDIYFDHA